MIGYRYHNDAGISPDLRPLGRFYGAARRRPRHTNWDVVLLDDAAMDMGVGRQQYCIDGDNSGSVRSDEMVRIMGEYCLWSRRRSAVKMEEANDGGAHTAVAVTASSPERVRRKEQGGAMGDVVGECHGLLIAEDYI